MRLDASFLFFYVRKAKLFKACRLNALIGSSVCPNKMFGVI